MKTCDKFHKDHPEVEGVFRVQDFGPTETVWWYSKKNGKYTRLNTSPESMHVRHTLHAPPTPADFVTFVFPWEFL